MTTIGFVKWLHRLNWYYGYWWFERHFSRWQFNRRMKACGYTHADIGTLIEKQFRMSLGEIAILTDGERAAQLDGWRPAPERLEL